MEWSSPADAGHYLRIEWLSLISWDDPEREPYLVSCLFACRIAGNFHRGNCFRLLYRSRSPHKARRRHRALMVSTA